MHRYLAISLAFVAFFMSAFISRTVFERLPHLEDELAYLYQARVFARGDIVIDSPEPRRSFWQPFVVDYNGKRFSKYTPGWSAILAVGVMVGTPWIMNAWLSAFTVALVYRVGESIFSRDTGLIAAFLTTFSPMFMLLSGTLMGHTTALCTGILFTWAYWQIEQERSPLRWGIIAGIALGLLTMNRPLTSIGIALPFVIYSVLRLLWTMICQREKLLSRLAPLVILGCIAVIFVLPIPVYRYLATGEATLNTYTLVWDYDQVGFGEGHGRSGHTLEKALRNARWDLSLAAADLFGWQTEPLTYEQRYHLMLRANRYPGTGLSWLLLPFGIIAGLAFFTNKQRRWTLILLAIPTAIILVHLAYWIGSQRYSTRYYSEGLAAAALLSAILPAVISQRVTRARWIVYPLLIGITAYSMITYTLPRIHLLRGFNNVFMADIEAINAQRTTDKPALVIITGERMTWRANGSFLGVTSPYLDSDIVLARDTLDRTYREQLLTMFPDREIIDLEGYGSKWWFAHTKPD